MLRGGEHIKGIKRTKTEVLKACMEQMQEGTVHFAKATPAEESNGEV